MTKTIFLVALSCLLFTGCGRADVDFSKPLDLKFTAIDGRQVDLSKMRGKVVLIDFWATWCPPCRVAGPDILKAYKKYHDQGFEVIGVSVDSDKQGLLDTVKQEGFPWPQYFDGKGIDNEIASKYDIEIFPTLWLIDKKGIRVGDNFFDLWATDGVVERTTSQATLEKVDAAIEKQLMAH